jgi:hypothetical protein
MALAIAALIARGRKEKSRKAKGQEWELPMKIAGTLVHLTGDLAQPVLTDGAAGKLLSSRRLRP